LYGVGNNERGQLTGPANQKVTTPVHIPPPAGKKWVVASCGCSHSLALTNEGQLFGWGSNEYGQLGIGKSFVETFLTPQPILGFGPNTISRVVCGYDNSFVWTDDGSVYSFGKNNVGQLSQRSLSPFFSPTKTNSGLVIRNVVPADNSTYILDEDNNVYFVGHMNSTLGESDLPLKIHSFGSDRVVSFAAGALHVLVLTASNALWSWGQNGYKQVGVQTPTNVTTFQRVSLPGNPRVTSIACGYHNSLALTDSGLFGWGSSSHGQLGVRVTTVYPPKNLTAGTPYSFNSLYMAQYMPFFSAVARGGGRGGVIEETVEEISFSMPGGQEDKDQTIRRLRETVSRQDQELAGLRAEVAHLRSLVKTPERSVDNVGTMNISFTK